MAKKKKAGARRLAGLDLVKAYGTRRVVDGVNLSLASGEICGLLGPNGAGKTTTFYMLAGLIPPDEGAVLLDGHEVTQLPMYKRARQGIAYLPQEASVFRRLTVEENILAILETKPLSPAERKQRCAELLEELGLTKLAKNKGTSLSGGERRRVEITRALALDPAFVLFDEPFAGIDPIVVADIQQIIRGLKAKGLGVLISDHNVRETLGVCDRAYIISQGQVLLEGKPEEIAINKIARKVYLGEEFRL